MSMLLNRKHVERFRRLHQGPEGLVLPGVWDVASARLFVAEGFTALGTTSAGVCWSVGRGNGWRAFLEACGRIARAVDVPVSFDIEDGFIDGVLADAAIMEDKIRAIRDLCEEMNYPLFVNARTDVFLGGPADLGEAVRRGRLYAEVGADSIFVPGLVDATAIQTFVKEVPAPVNIYALPNVPPVIRLAALGVRRLSVGCGPMQSLLAHAQRIARALRDEGNYDSFVDDWMPYKEAEAMCA